MKLLPAILTLSILGIVSPAAGAGLQGLGNELEKKAKPLTFLWIADMPAQPQYAPPAIYMAANTVSAQTHGAASAYKLGVCQAINYPADIAPTVYAKTYLYQYLHKDFDFDFTPDGGDRTDTSVRIIEQPKHGRLVQQYPDATDYQEFMYQYIPDANFEGYDKFVMEISAGGNTVQIYYTMGVASGPIGGMNEQGERTDSSICDRPHWKISAVLDSNGNTAITAVDYLSPVAGTSTPITNANALSAWLSLAQLDGKVVDMTGITVTFADLKGAAIGQTTDSDYMTATLSPSPSPASGRGEFGQWQPQQRR